MAVEPVQDLVRILLEKDGYWVRSNVRFKVKMPTQGTGQTAAYADLDLVAIRVDPATGLVTDRLWAEVKAHLTLSLSASNLKAFADDYAVFLDLDRLTPSKEHARRTYKKQAAFQAASVLLGPTFRRRLYFAGKFPADKGAAAAQLLPDVEIVFVRDLLKERLGELSHLEGDEPVVRMVNLLAAMGLMKED